MTGARQNIDFANAKPGPKRAARWLAFLGGAALIGAVPFWIDAARQRDQLTQALARTEKLRTVAVVPASPARSADPRQVARERALRDITRGLATPWGDLFAALEAAPTQSVALLAIEPTVANRSVRLTAEARDSKAMLAYLAALQKDFRLTHVVLVSHQVQAQTPGTPVRFLIQALWADAR